jgi:hypothetical protein
MFPKVLSFLIFLLSIFRLNGQTITLLDSGHRVSLRGLSAVSDQVIWVSGSSGTVGLTTDSGQQWKWLRVPRYEKSDFRDIQAFSDQEAVIMGITRPAVVLRTVDAGKTWSTVLEEPDTVVFLDAMCFLGDKGALVGDPDKGKIFFAETFDRGKTWTKANISPFERTEPGEAFFASSGSNAVMLPSNHTDEEPKMILVSGGSKSCLYISGTRFPLFMNQGKETTGANSIAVNPSDPFQLFVVGGDYKNDTIQQGNSLLIRVDPFQQTTPYTPPHGYRSSVDYIDAKRLICCGTSGVDVSFDGGLHWKLISNRSFHVCAKSKTGKTVFLAGPDGTIARLNL